MNNEQMQQQNRNNGAPNMQQGIPNMQQGMPNMQQTMPNQQPEYIQNIQPPVNNGNDKNSFKKKIIRGASAFFVMALIGLGLYLATDTSSSVNTSRAAEQALEKHMSTSIAAGTKLASKDAEYIGGDLTITHNSKADETDLYIWDYAAEDGDYVQVFVDGKSMGEPFMIKNKPVVFTVPTECEIEVVGTHDGGGGITYAVYYGMNKTTYLNGMDVNDSNVYTLEYED